MISNLRQFGPAPVEVQNNAKPQPRRLNAGKLYYTLHDTEKVETMLLDEVKNKLEFRKIVEPLLRDIFGKFSVVNVIALGPTIVHGLDALKKTIANSSFSKSKDSVNASTDTINEYRNKTLRFVRSNYYLYIDNWKFEIIKSDLIQQKYFRKPLLVEET
jgi:hypothetical protein